MSGRRPTLLSEALLSQMQQELQDLISREAKPLANDAAVILRRDAGFATLVEECEEVTPTWKDLQTDAAALFLSVVRKLAAAFAAKPADAAQSLDTPV